MSCGTRAPHAPAPHASAPHAPAPHAPEPHAPAPHAKCIFFVKKFSISVLHVFHELWEKLNKQSSDKLKLVKMAE